MRSSTSSRSGSTSRWPATRAGVLGSAIIKGQATEIIDVGHFLPLAFEDWFRRKEQPAARTPRARCCWSTISRSSATCSRRCCRPPAIRSPPSRRRRRGAGAAQGRPRLRRRDHRHRNAGHGRLPVRAKPCAPIRAPPHLPVIALSLDGFGRSDRARPQGRLPRLRRQVRPPGADRGAARSRLADHSDAGRAA